MKRRVKREPSTLNRTTNPEPPSQSSVDESTHVIEQKRRVLRSQYFALHNKINVERDDLVKADSEKFASIIKEFEDLHKQVDKPREQVADAEALFGIATTLVSSVKSQSNEGITPAGFCSCLVSTYGQLESNDYDNSDAHTPVSIKWKEIGLAVSSVFKQCSGFDTMMGPMNTELKPRKTAVVRRRERPPHTSQPENVETETEEKTDTDRNMSTMFGILRRNKCVTLENLMLNRRSFAQTVENLFALSFLVKDGRAEVTVDEAGSHLVAPRNAPAAASISNKDVTYNHFVFRFDFRDWKLMMDMVPEGDEMMPHRESSDSSQVGSEANDTQHALPRTPIRKLTRNRGLIVQEESVVEDSPENDDNGVSKIRRCKRRLA